MRISDWSSDVCSSDLKRDKALGPRPLLSRRLPLMPWLATAQQRPRGSATSIRPSWAGQLIALPGVAPAPSVIESPKVTSTRVAALPPIASPLTTPDARARRGETRSSDPVAYPATHRSEEHTSDSSHYCATRMPYSDCKK